MLKKLLAAVLASAMVFSVVACNKGKNPDSAAPGEIEFWTTYNTEKIIRNMAASEYDAVNLGETMSVEACKGETEGGQIIMTAKSAVSSYNAEVSDLTASDGTVLPKARITIYAEKYIDVRTIHATYNDPPKGWYPDALLPIEKAVEYGENKIAEGENQGLYVSVDVPLDQKAGVYTGYVRVTYDDKTKDVPVRLTVYDLEVSPVTHSKSYFNLSFSWYAGELDTTQELWDRDADMLLSHRISPSKLFTDRDVADTEECAERYVEEVYRRVKDYGMSTINSPWTTETAEKTEIMKHFVERLIIRQLESKKAGENLELINKVILKGKDEPAISALGSVQEDTERFWAALADIKAWVEDSAEDLKAEYGVDDAYLAGVIGDVGKIPNLITFGTAGSEQYNTAVDAYCPLFNLYDSEASRASFDVEADEGEFGKHGKELWWYGCTNPRPPYPSYHTEDTLVSARAVSWIMSRYDIIGNLFWSATVYAIYDGKAYQPIDDYYTGKADRFYTCNGDGYLFYPGAPYGIKGPVGCMRLEAIRDGNEDYELFYALKNKYAEKGVSADKIQAQISDLIYSGATMKYDNVSAQFLAARRALVQLCMLAESDAEVCITDVVDDGAGNVTYGVTAKEGTVLTSGGTEVAGTPAGSGRTSYEVKVSLSGNTNFVELGVKDSDLGFVFNLGGKVVSFGPDKILDGSNKFDVLAASGVTVNASIEDEKGVHLEVGALSVPDEEPSGRMQGIRYTSSLIGSMGSDVKRLIFFIRNDGEEEIPFRMNARQAHSSESKELLSSGNVTLAPGLNKIEVSLNAIFNLSVNKIEYVNFYFNHAAGKSFPARSVYIEKMVVYYESV